jgi:DNA-directed RNA polymerase subunit RPC12/RpoP
VAILENEVWVTCGTHVDKHYESLGYTLPKVINQNGKLSTVNGEKILVKVRDLLNGSHVKVTKICDTCGKHVPDVIYNAVLKARKKGDGLDRCKNCNSKKNWSINKAKISYEKSLEYYAKTNNQNHLLNEFSEKNLKKTNEISYGTRDEYLWNCLKCSSEYSMRVNNRTLNGYNCPYCSGQKVNHTNCLWTTHPEIAKLLKDPQRGYEINAGRNKQELFVCGKCGNELKKIVNNIVNRGYVPCSKCSDGLSYPEKFMISVLDQIGIDYEPQKTFEWSKKIYHLHPKFKKLSGMKKYDFHMPSMDMIIETHGNQHYDRGFDYLGGRNINEEMENDDLKMFLALNNGIKKYIILDCRNSELEWIKNSILKSKLAGLFELSTIDWLKCHEFACNTLVKTVCDLWENGVTNTAKIEELVKIDRVSVIRYLKQGVKLGWCDYNPKEIMKKSGYNISQKNKRQIIQLTKNNDYIRTWESIGEAENELGLTNISGACRGVKKSSGGFIWMYKEDYENLCNNS